MFSSMRDALTPNRPLGLICVLVLLLTTGAAGPPPPARAPSGTCATDPSAPSARIAATPWPQLRYDLSLLDQVRGAPSVLVAVIDSGVDGTSPHLASAVAAGVDALDPGGDGRRDCVGHGTAVASIIAGRPVAGSGFRGMAPGTTILPVRVNERVEPGSAADSARDLVALVRGIEEAVAHRPRPAVINLSITTTYDSPALRRAVQEAVAADIVVVAAAGNQHASGDPATYPAGYPGVVGVGAISADGQRLDISQVGPYVDLVAPGGKVVAAAPGGGNRVYTGTSFAAAFVAATAALVRERWPGMGQADVVRRLLATADPPAGGRGSPGYGSGVLNPVRALTEVGYAAGTPPGPRPPAAIAPPASPPSRTPLGVAAALLLAAAAVLVVAMTIPLGRRRRWRGGN